MILIETSALVNVLRDRTGVLAQRLLLIAGDEEMVISRFTELEVLMGAGDEADWQRLISYFAKRTLLDPTPATWQGAARIYVDLRRKGHTIRSTIDCCIAQLALETDIMLVHNDRDFDAIATVCALKHRHFDLDTSSQ